MSLGSVSLRSGQILVGHSNSEPCLGICFWDFLVLHFLFFTKSVCFVEQPKFPVDGPYRLQLEDFFVFLSVFVLLVG